jgi:hypothetical protein
MYDKVVQWKVEHGMATPVNRNLKYGGSSDAEKWDMVHPDWSTFKNWMKSGNRTIPSIDVPSGEHSAKDVEICLEQNECSYKCRVTKGDADAYCDAQCDNYHPALRFRPKKWTDVDIERAFCSGFLANPEHNVDFIAKNVLDKWEQFKKRFFVERPKPMRLPDSEKATFTP